MAVVTLPVGVHPVQLVVNDGLLARTNEVTVEIITTGQAVERLAALVEEGTENPAPLVASLRAALAAIDRSQPATAINQLEAFTQKVQAQVAPAACVRGRSRARIGSGVCRHSFRPFDPPPRRMGAAAGSCGLDARNAHASRRQSNP